jgi:hypothetical protein
MQGSNILDGFSKKMIKEDHYLACTTKMFEIELRRPFDSLSLASGQTTWIVQTTPYTGASEHTSSRLSDYSLVKELRCKRCWQLSLPPS